MVDLYKLISYALDMNNNWSTLLLSVAALIVALSIGYYFVIFLPQKEQEKIQQEKQKNTAMEEKKTNEKLLLNYCLEDAEKSYNYNWNKTCSTQRLEDECNLPSNMADSIDNYRKQQKDECFKKYPQ